MFFSLSPEAAAVLLLLAGCLLLAISLVCTTNPFGRANAPCSDLEVAWLAGWVAGLLQFGCSRDLSLKG